MPERHTSHLPQRRCQVAISNRNKCAVECICHSKCTSHQRDLCRTAVRGDLSQRLDSNFVCDTVWGWYLLTAYLALLAADAAWAALQLARPALNPAWAAANLTEAQVPHRSQPCAFLCLMLHVLDFQICLACLLDFHMLRHSGSAVGSASDCNPSQSKGLRSAAAAAATAAAGPAAL